MRIESSSINASLLRQTNQSALFSNVMSKNIGNRITSLQEQLKKVNEDETPSSKERVEIKKQLNTQIENLGQLLVKKQAEMELKSKALEPETDSGNGLPETDDPGAVSVEQMMAVLDGSSSYTEAGKLDAVKTSLDGKSRILASQIDADAARGLDTAEKTKQLAGIQARIQTIDKRLAEDAAAGSQKSGGDGGKTDEEKSAGGASALDIIV